MREMLLYSTVTILLLLVFSVYAAEAASGLTVSARPGTLNSFQCSSVTGRIIIDSQEPGEYSVDIDGVPGDWLEYQESVYVDGTETVNYIVNPQKGGTYHLTILVDGPGGYVEEGVKFWAGKKETAISADKVDTAELEDSGFTGMITLGGPGQTAATVAAVALAAVFSLFIARRALRHEDPYDGMGF